MNGKKILKWCWFPVLVILLAAWYFYPVTFLSGTGPEEVGSIRLFDGNTGCALEITDRADIAGIVENLQSVPVRRSGISLMNMGYRFRLTFLDGAGQEIDELIVNSSDTIRKDPFFYSSEDGGLCFDFLLGLLDAAYGYSR